VPPELSAAAAQAQELLAERATRAAARAGELGRAVLASATVRLDGEVDVAACVFASRRAEERYFVWEQPDRDRFAIGGLGNAVAVSAHGPERFDEVAKRCAAVMHEAEWEGTARAVADGPVWLGGFSFAAGGGASREWNTLPEGLMFVPELSLVRQGGRLSATVNVACLPDSDPRELADRAMARLSALRDEPMPLLDPDPVGGHEIASVLPPSDYEYAVAQARERIRASQLKKVVLAREVRVFGGLPIRPAAVFDGLRSGFPSCYCFCVGTPELAFVGASPELLLRREGSRLATVALAGSARRSADPAVDDHLGERLRRSDKELSEHRIVVARIQRSLAPLSVWVTSADEPSLVKIANIQHLATPLRAQLTEPRSAVDLAGELHPTPAVGGEPWPAARKLLFELEQMDRGWYAGPVGWMDATEDGEFCIALRSALLEGRVAHCYAGVGVVADSDPEAELAETEVKFQALLAVLTGA
jgi:isochorismate synthase